MNEYHPIELAYTAMREYQQIAQSDLLESIDVRLRNLGSEIMAAEIKNDHESIKSLNTTKIELFKYRNLILKIQSEIDRIYDRVSPIDHISCITQDIEDQTPSVAPVNAPPTHNYVRVINPKPHDDSTVIMLSDGKKMRISSGSSMNGQSRRNGNFPNNKPKKIIAHTEPKTHNPSGMYEPFILRTLLRYEDEGVKPFPEFTFIRDETIALMKREGSWMPGDDEHLQTGIPRSFSQIESKRSNFIKNGIIYMAHSKIYRLTEEGLILARQYQAHVDQRRLQTV